MLFEDVDPTPPLVSSRELRLDIIPSGFRFADFRTELTFHLRLELEICI